MIIFEHIRWKNFLSTGNNFTEIDLIKTSSTLIVGHNGSGKSTLLDAISFALFGKPHRAITKNQLINSVNGKGTEVEVKFTIGSAKFRVLRGIKPNTFEIWKNGEMINQSSHSKEYQKILEQNILKLNHKSFHQIVVLGSSSFIPFMQLPAHHRRDVIEDLLDINIFSKMNQIIKEKNAVLRENLKDNSHQMDLKNNNIESQKKYIRDITQINKDELKDKNKKIDEIHDEIQLLNNKNASHTDFIIKHSDEIGRRLKEYHDQKQAIMQSQSEAHASIKNIVKESKFYEQNDTCPTCEQEIDKEFKDKKIHECKDQAKEINEALEKLSGIATTNNNNIDHWAEKSEELRNHQSEINGNNKTIESLQNQVKNLNDDIEKLSSREGDLGKANADLTKIMKERDVLLETKLTLNEEYSYNNVMSEMLKDTGIKTKVIKQYVPVINKLVNQYLQVLDFFVHFNLDESFQETIRSRHRDSFSYDSFSEGEKQRIDLALLFTWRQIAKMKNSVATNLLILDETFDSSLDHDGVDNLMKILNTLDDNTNVFVISHKGDILDGKFKEKLEFIKDRNFSKMVA